MGRYAITARKTRAGAVVPNTHRPRSLRALTCSPALVAKPGR
jgi:hypothetical protein